MKLSLHSSGLSIDDSSTIFIQILVGCFHPNKSDLYDNVNLLLKKKL